MMVDYSSFFLATCLLSLSFVHSVNCSAGGFTVYAAENSPQVAQSFSDLTFSPQTDREVSTETLPSWRWWLVLALIPIALGGGVWYGVQRGRLQTCIPEELNSSAGSEVDESPISNSTEEKLSPLDLDSEPSEQNQLNQPLDSIAVTEITRLSRVDRVTTLIHELHSQNPNKRRKAIWELGQQSDSRAIQPLVNLLLDSDSQQRSLILAAVSEISVRTLKPMSRALMMTIQDDSSEVRKNSIRDASRLFEFVIQMSQLLQYATDDADPEVQETAKWALAQINRVHLVSSSTEALPNPRDLRFSSPLNGTPDARSSFAEEIE